MEKELLEAGKIINTHGIHGEVKIEPWCDTPEVFCGFRILFLNGAPRNVLSARIHGRFVLVRFEGVETIDAAIPLKNTVLYVERSSIPLPEGSHFIADLIGLLVLDDETGAELGRLTDVLPLPKHDVYVVTGAREYLIPAVDAFIVQRDIENGTLRVRLLEGM